MAQWRQVRRMTSHQCLKIDLKWFGHVSSIIQLINPEEYLANDLRRYSLIFSQERAYTVSHNNPHYQTQASSPQIYRTYDSRSATGTW